MAKTKARKSNVVGLRGSVPAHGVPVSGVVEMLRDLLAEAEKGGVTGLGAFWIGPAQSIHTQWDGVADSHHFVAGSAMLHHYVMVAKYRLDHDPDA